MAELLQLIISGTAQGMIYALIAFGYNITFSTSKTINFSLGNLLMVGGVVGFILYMDKATGQPLGRMIWLPILAVLIVNSLLGLVVYKTAVEPSLKRNSEYSWVLATLAFGLIVRNLVEQLWSTNDYRFASPLGDTPIRVAGVGVYPQELLIIGVAVFIVVAVELFRRKTIFGKAVSAVSEDKQTASLMGINQNFVLQFSFMLSTAIAGIAGILVAPITFVSASMGLTLGIKAYAVAIIGGLESGYGMLVGGLLLGLSESFTARYISTGYKDTPGFVLLIIVILFMPSGLFG
ncbi:MAG: branched-chain amino acid ABC transporter permease, partial [Proteobacteria bacterium]